MSAATRLTIGLLFLISSLRPAFAQEVQIGVLALFHPRQLVVRPASSGALVLHAGGSSYVLEKSSGVGSAHIRIVDGRIALQVGSHTLRTAAISADGREGEPVEFVLSVPGKITRTYRGRLEVKSSSGVLVAIVRMDLEAAVASVVAAESSPGTPMEALKAQAVASRSYFVAARSRHHDFDFCDTTHCQFLRESPSPGSAAARAVAETRGLVLAYESQPVAAMYTRSCSGRTRTPAEIGLPSGGYPYFAVECRYCREHPDRWQSRILVRDGATLHSSNELDRLRLDRRVGWSAVPSNNFVMTKKDGQLMLRGTGRGHGVGLCQAGARGMAKEGANFRDILRHYYPNTTLISAESFVSVR